VAGIGLYPVDLYFDGRKHLQQSCEIYSNVIVR